MTAEMSERRRLILKLVIQEHIENSNPVASDLLVRKHGLKVSSATVRNDLSALEELGYLTHLHTSAGRVPTDSGYRYYVENLMDRMPLTITEQRTIRHQFYQVRSEFDQWIHLAGAVLARTAQNASVVTLPRSYVARFKHIELIAIQDTTILIVLVLNDGNVRQQSINVDATFMQEELSRSADRINDVCADATVYKVETFLHQDRSQHNSQISDFEHLVLELVIRSMRQIEEQFNQDIYSDGLMEILNQPEFAQVDRVRQVVALLQDGKELKPLISRVLLSNGVQVVIGGEHAQDEMREYSVVLSRYGISGAAAGVLGVIGPTRMAYPRTISAVGYISAVMSDLMGDIYGDQK
ncbi:MAG: heat-inducible transcriptional repressor HrcA [Chloroflexota bacterium]